MTNDGEQKGRFFARRYSAGPFVDEKCPSDAESLTLTPLACWAGLTAPQRGQLVAQLLADVDAAAPNKAERPNETRHTSRLKLRMFTEREGGCRIMPLKTIVGFVFIEMVFLYPSDEPRRGRG